MHQKIRFWRSLLFGLDVLLLAAWWVAAYFVRFEHLPNPRGWVTPPLGEYLIALWLFPFAWAALFDGLGLHDLRRRTSRAGEVLQLARASGLFTLLVVSGAWLVFKAGYSRVFLGAFWVGGTGLLLLARIGFRELLRQLRRSGVIAREAVIVGTGPLAREVQARLRRHPELGLRLRGFLTVHPEQVGSAIDDVPVIGAVEELKALVRTGGVAEVFFAQSAELEPHLDGVLAELSDELVDVNLVSDLYKHSLLGARVEDFEGMPLLSVTASPMIGWGYVTKRAFDVALAGFGLVVAVPIMALAALAVKLTSRGPAFYRQERLGLDGETFTIHKIRTMVVEAEKDGPVWGIPNDPRVTPVGRVLRAFSIDELPQLWNVLRGDMSLVGPRPAQPVFVQEFRSSIPRYNLRHRVKPGLTGWAQIHGQRGDAPPDERLQYDLFYIRNWSVALDVKILWRTVWGGFLNRNA